MKRNLFIGSITLLASSLILVGCGNQNKASSQSSSNTSSSSVSSSSVSSSNSSSTTSSSSNTSSSASSATTNNQKAQTKVNSKTAGVLVALLVRPDWFKSEVGSSLKYSETAGGEYKNYGAFYGQGDTSDHLAFQLNGNTVNYEYWDQDSSEPNGGHKITGSVALNRLINDYYINQDQKDEVNGYVNKLPLDSID
ncbi:hypothetical protein MOO44_08580 [Nicoliella spurrieriana]|uniref:Lreu-0056-like domain-containing protein n=1 Tax=Nicoliella spurrieriana TaxID=2925830 RepID=A0A976RSB7_9LACO|nr:hypothetical protein [Nicoliella spurrieriana]UQS86903.1 hypothetical protein MOO44_08580 [Nicoliella spurrieriana]